MALLEYYLMWGAMGALSLYMAITLLLCRVNTTNRIKKFVTYPIIIFVCGLAAGIYFKTGAYNGVRDKLALEQIDKSISYLHKQENLTKDIVILELDRLQKNVPKSERTWAKLGDMYQSLSLFEKAEKAFKQARTYNQQEPYYPVQEAYCQVMLNNGQISAEVVQGLSQLQTQHPNHKGVLNLLALHAYQHQDYQLAAQNWAQILKASIDITAGERQTITKALQDTNSHLGKLSLSQDSDVFALQVKVDIAQALKNKLSDGDIVYVFAKHVQGPPMPIAVVRQPLQSFPLQVTLSDNDNMMVTNPLSQAESVLIGARVSKSGQAIPQVGDLEGFSEVVVLKQAPRLVKVEISQER